EENLKDSTPRRRRHSHVEQSLCKPAAPDEKALYSAFTGPVTRLNASRRAQLGVRPDEGTKNQPLPSRLFKTRFRFLDCGIFFECGLENAFQGDSPSCLCEARDQHQHQHKEANTG